jgi:hypothetical protein
VEEQELLVTCDAFELQNSPTVNTAVFDLKIVKSIPLKIDLGAK